MCVTTVSLFLVSSTYLSNISLVVSYYLEFHRAYVSDIAFKRLSCSLGDCLRRSNSLSVGEFDNEKSYHVFRLNSHDIRLFLLHFIIFYFCFMCFAIIIRYH